LSNNRQPIISGVIRSTSASNKRCAHSETDFTKPLIRTIKQD